MINDKDHVPGSSLREFQMNPSRQRKSSPQQRPENATAPRQRITPRQQHWSYINQHPHQQRVRAQPVREAPIPASVIERPSSPSNDLWENWQKEIQPAANNANQQLSVPESERTIQPPEEIQSQHGSNKAENQNHLPWAFQLALEERRMEKQGMVDFQNQFNRMEVLKQKTFEFTAELKRDFKKQIEIFNQARRTPAHLAKIYKVSNTREDFMLFRNGVKLIISGQKAGRILFAFNQYMGQIFAPSQNPSLEILASWGALDQLIWTYKGERVERSDVIRYFFTEFIQQSAR